jgi:hypothetical protein
MYPCPLQLPSHRRGARGGALWGTQEAMRGTRLRPERRRHCSAGSSVQAARFLTLQDTEARITDSFALLKMLCENADEIAEEGWRRSRTGLSNCVLGRRGAVPRLGIDY